MPDSASDPLEPGRLIDLTGGGSDPSAYQNLSPGGRFGGDINNYLGYISAKNTGGQFGNGNEDRSDINLPGGYGRLVSAIINGLVNNARAGGPGQAPENPFTSGGYPFQAWSGPGASFGPPGGSLHGLIDQGNSNNVDGPDNPFNKLDQNPGEAPQGKRGGGGGGGGSLTFTPYGGVPYTASFVGYDPIAPGGAAHPAKMIQNVVNAGTVAKPNSSSPGNYSGGSRGGGGGTGGGGGRSGGRIPGVQYGGTPPAVPPGGEKRPDGRIFDANGRTIYIPDGSGGGAGGGTGTGGGGNPLTPGAPFGGQIPDGGIVHAITGGNPISGVTPTDRDSHGLNFNNLDKSTPGWVHDPTQGINNTAGMPLPTLPDPSGYTTDSYMQYLHGLGYTQEDIANILGAYGFSIGNPQQGPSDEPVDGMWPGKMTGADPPAGWPMKSPGEQQIGWGWGTGPVVRGADGYHFANQGANGGGGGRENAAQTLANAGSLFWGAR